MSIDEVVRAALEQVETTPGPPVELHIDADLPLIEADAAQLERVFANLLENARRYSRRAAGPGARARASAAG